MAGLISLKNIVVTYGSDFSLSVENFDFQAQSIYILTGPNGAGKSTLLRSLAMLTLPQSGELHFAGNCIWPSHQSLIQYRRKVTLVEQSPYLLDGTVSRNLTFGLKMRGIRKVELGPRIEAALALVGLEGFELRKSGELSDGEIKRVALARALVLKPEVLLLDEPGSNIDNKSLAAIEDLICNLPDQGVTVIMSSHDFSQADRLGGEMIRIENGRLLDCNN